MITIEIDDRAVLNALTRLQGRTSDMSSLMHDIGEYLTETTKRRFDTTTAPDGSRWAENSDITLLGYLNRYKGSFRKDGRLTQKGASRLGGKKPLTGRTGGGASLMATINYKAGRDFVEIGSPKEYAAMQQFGGQKSKFPHLWGDIPARPFLGISDQDRNMILDEISEYLNQSFRP
jgi:phage virion morphogenesis protein